MFKKILIANRGEIACRVIKTARKMGIATVAVYSEADKDAMHVEHGRRGRLHRPAAVEGILSADRQDHRRLQGDRCRGRASGLRLPFRESGVLAPAGRRAASFSSAPSTIRWPRWATRSPRRSWRSRPRSTPFPATTTPSTRPSRRWRSPSDIGYPVMIKASAGGGGKGLRVAYDDKEAHEGFAACKTEAKNAFGDDRIFVEKFVEEPRHIEIQLIGDAHGNTIYLHERECSLQRRHQKVIEEAPSSFIDPADAQGHGRAGRGAGPRGELPERRHRRVRRRQGQEFLLPRNEHAPAGRASGDRIDHRHSIWSS